jgi:spore coat protein JB
MKSETDKSGLLEQITALGLATIDLHLYLNTHPMDQEALVKHNSLMMQSKMLKNKYERCYGMLSAHGSISPYPWQWINEPWPWEYDANFEFKVEEE